MASRKGLREIQWGEDGTCIYDNGHIPAEEFLRCIREWGGSDIDQDTRNALTVENVQHVRFRPMSPYEARSQGCDFGVMVADGNSGYPVTRIMFS